MCQNWAGTGPMLLASAQNWPSSGSHEITAHGFSEMMSGDDNFCLNFFHDHLQIRQKKIIWCWLYNAAIFKKSTLIEEMAWHHPGAIAEAMMTERVPVPQCVNPLPLVTTSCVDSL